MGATDDAVDGGGAGGSIGVGGNIGQGGSSRNGEAPGTGGVSGTGGATGTGDTANTGGAAGTGGANGSGGASGTGGMAGTGGATGGSSITGMGGLTGAGGVTGTGGRTGTGGTSRTGGTTGAGTAKGTGGQSTGGTSGPSPTGGSTAVGPHVKFVGNITTSNGATDIGSLKYADYWNQVSPQNEGKWGSVSNARGQYNWGALDTVYKYAETNKMVFKEHTFIWGAQQPGYSITETDVKDWMKQFCARYPNVRIIDVVNEPPPHTNPSYVNAIGGGTNGDWAWIANAFKWAREACPNAILVLNDFNNIEWDGDNKHMIDIVRAIKKLDAPIDAIGCQSHDLDFNNGIDLAGVKRRLDALIAEVPDIYITEMDISTKDDALQLKLYQRFFPLFWESPNIKGITIWGWVVGRTWSLAPDSGLITSAGVKRPAFTWLLEQIGR